MYKKKKLFIEFTINILKCSKQFSLSKSYHGIDEYSGIKVYYTNTTHGLDI